VMLAAYTAFLHEEYARDELVVAVPVDAERFQDR
jgi:hypothetical protein